MRKWIKLVEEIEDQNVLSDVYMLVNAYVTHGEWRSPTEFDQRLHALMKMIPRPDHGLDLYRALRLSEDQLAQYHAGTLVLQDRQFSSWTKSLDSAHRIAQTKGSRVLILKQHFDADHIVIDIPDFYEEHEFTQYGSFSEYHNFVRIEQEVIVYHSGTIHLTAENSELFKAPEIEPPMMGDKVYYHEDDEDGLLISSVDDDQPYADRSLFNVTLDDGDEATVRCTGPKEWEIVNLAITEGIADDLEYDPLRFFWYHPQHGMRTFGDEDKDHATFAYEDIHGREDDFVSHADEDEEGFLWNSHQIGKAISLGWVRGRYTKPGYIGPLSELSLQGEARNVYRAAKWFSAHHPIDVLYLDFAESDQSFWSMDEHADKALKGERLAYYLKRGRVPSAMVMEDIQWNPKPRGMLDEETLVWLDIEKVDASFAKDRNFYVDGPDSKNAIGRRYDQFGEWLKQGIAVNPPEIHLNAWGEISFGNGRHRYAWMRNNGETRMPFVVPKEDAVEIKRRFG